jgi:hypothetical protein
MAKSKIGVTFENHITDENGFTISSIVNVKTTDGCDAARSYVVETICEACTHPMHVSYLYSDFNDVHSFFIERKNEAL